MEIIVLDASAILNYLLVENDSAVKEIKSIIQKAKTKKIKIYASQLLPLEVGNALKNKLSLEKTAKVLSQLKVLTINYQSFTSENIEEIVNTSYKFDTTVYDTSYHYLAKIYDGTFVTCDRAYFQKAKSWGNIKLI